MSGYLQRLSGTLFYLLGLSFFGGYLLVRNEIGGMWPAWWLRVADLPLAFAAVAYGGTSLYRSVIRDRPSLPKAILVSVPLVAFLTVILVLNFWDA